MVLQFGSEPLLFMVSKYTHDNDLVVLYFTISIKAEMLYEIYVVLDEKLVYTILFRMHLKIKIFENLRNLIG